MSYVVPFSECLARPSEKNANYYLIDHLEGARTYMRSFFEKNLTEPERTLLEFAALFHDVGKANTKWQHYITGKITKGPNHAGCGAIFFSYVAYHYLQVENMWEDYQMLWLNLTRDIADHHGTLKNFVKYDSIDKGKFFKMDLTGIKKWIHSLYPSIPSLGTSLSYQEKDLNNWQYDEFPQLAGDVIFDFLSEQLTEEKSVDEMMKVLQVWRTFTSMLISSDRMDINPIFDDRFNDIDLEQMKDQFNRFLKDSQKRSLADKRNEAQEHILAKWKKDPKQSYYTLEMPTGYGKTVTSIRLAQRLMKEKRLSKIIYVAPYLSILKQNAESIGQLLDIQPLEHHSMAILQERVLQEDISSDQMTDLDTQCWANKIVCTSFVQFMKAIFPARAQESLRRIYLNRSVIIIDEPQIIDATVWNLFLKGLDSLRKIYHLTIIFCSATMPPFRYGIEKDPIRLRVNLLKGESRYQIQIHDPVTAEICAEKLINSDKRTGIVITNTIQDAMNVYKELEDRIDDEQLYLLHGLMIPLHKTILIQRIQELLAKREKQSPLRLVSTQIIEAGVDLSFEYMFRALPILPSLTQAAGRVNRNGEDSLGLIETGKFLREDGRDTRFIYPQSICSISDELLFQKNVWLEHELDDLVQQFYEQMFVENTYEAVLQDIENAYTGNWEKITKHQVFQEENEARLPMFIPFDWRKHLDDLPQNLFQLIKGFKIKTPDDLYEIYLNRKLRNTWSYHKNRLFQLLFYQFVINVPVKEALLRITKEDYLRYKVPKLEDDYAYDFKKGFILSTVQTSNWLI